MMYVRLLLIAMALVIFAEPGFSSSIPVILNYSDTAYAGDVIYLQGSGFGSTPYVQYSYNDSNWQALTVTSSANSIVLVKISAMELSLPDLLTIRVSADGSNWSKPVYINQAKAFSLDSDQIAPSGAFRIFGRDLLFARTPTVRLVDTISGAQLIASVDKTRSSSFVLQATAPHAIVASHSYKVFVSNGYSGRSRTGGEILAEQQLKGRAIGIDRWNLGTPWAADLDYYNNVYNIRSDSRLSSHTQGGGQTDDTDTLRNAIYIASKAGGGVVYLPAGSYNLRYQNGCGVTLAKRVAIVGDGQGVTRINYGFGVPPSSGTGYGACFSDQSGLAYLTMNNVNESGLWPESGLSIGATDVFLQHISWNIGTSQWLSLTSMNHMAIENSIFSQGIDSAFNFNGVLNLTGCSWCKISSNTINFAVGGMLFDSMQNSVFENNVVVRDVTTTPDPRSVTHFLEANFASNLIIIGNRFSSLGSSLPTSNDGEVINTEGGGPERRNEFRGTVSASTALNLTDLAQDFSKSSNSFPALRPGATIAIVSGEGTGQVRQVTAVSSDFQTITIDHPWDIPPAIGSHYATFDWSAYRWIIANNSMQNTFKGIEIWDASSKDILIDSNSMTDSAGILLSPTQNPPGAFSLTWGIDINNNTVVDSAGTRPAFVAVLPREDQQTSSFGTAVIGVQLRGNNIVAHVPNVLSQNHSDNDFATIEGFICSWQWQTDWAGYDTLNTVAPVLGTIFQGNSAKSSNTAILLNTGDSQTIFSDQILQDVAVVSQDRVIPGALEASSGTTILNRLNNTLLTTTGQLPNPIEAYWTPAKANTILFNASRLSTTPSVTPVGSGSAVADVSNMVNRQVSGDIDAIVHIEMDPGASATSIGMLMLRGSITQSSPFITVGRNMSGNIVVGSRNTAGVAQDTVIASTSTSDWVRITKTGSRCNLFSSSDGTTWISAGTILADFIPAQYYVGLTGISDGLTNHVEVRFSNFQVQSLTTLQ